jgi:NAD(P)-dependent dehydrogenase (short-subunit alcohol dehydrogenase family)
VWACLDIVLRPFGIGVSSIVPGCFRTSIGRLPDAVSDSPPYESSAAAFREGFLGRLASAPDDFSELVAAAVDAATAVDPRARYVVGGGAAESIRPLVDGLARLHQAEVERVGLAR